MELQSVILLLGGNQGEVEQRLDMASLLIEERIGEVVQRSRMLQSEAWGFECEGVFTNQAIEVHTALSPHELLAETQRIEVELGRDKGLELEFKSRTKQNYAPRLLDIDIIFYAQRVIEHEELTIPHPRACEREFVLLPILQIAPHRLHPLEGKTIEEIYKKGWG